MRDIISRLWNAFKYSMDGIQSAWQDEWAFRAEMIIFVMSLPITFIISDNGLHRILLLGSIIFVLICELINSAIENVTDRISLEKHPLAKKAKDQGSACVLFACVFACIVWMWVLSLYFCNLS